MWDVISAKMANFVDVWRHERDKEKGCIKDWHILSCCDIKPNYIHSRIVINSPPRLAKPSPRSKSLHRCKVCRNTFARASAMLSHMRVHKWVTTSFSSPSAWVQGTAWVCHIIVIISWLAHPYSSVSSFCVQCVSV